MKLLLFGGTFDPPHIGHMQLLKNAIQAVRPNRVLVVPAGTPPHKAASTTPGKLRLAMCSCFSPLFNNIAISDMEISQNGKSYTINTVNTIMQQQPVAKIYLCLGSDSLVDFTSWYCHEEILAKVVLVAMCRKRQDAAKAAKAAQLLRAGGGRVLFAPGRVQEVSSSQLRAAIAKGDAQAFTKIPPPADAIVRQQGLYSKQTVGGPFC